MSNKKSSTRTKLNARKDTTEKVIGVSIEITRHYRHLVEFSLVSKKGLHEVLQMYVEIVRMYRCVPSPIAAEAMGFRNNYSLTLVPDFRLYPILPPTLTNSRDTWVLKGKEIDLFGIRFDWPHMTSAEVAIKAEVYNHEKKESEVISSSVITLNRQGEQPTESSFIPEDAIIQMSPYLYKLLTVEGLRDKIGSNERQLNTEAHKEIASIFNCEPMDLDRLLDKNDDNLDLIFDANINPAIASQLLKVARVLRKHLDSQEVPPSISVGQIVMGNNVKITPVPKSIAIRTPWISGSFYLASIVVVGTLLMVMAKIVHPLALPLVLASTLLGVSLVGAFQLRQDKSLSQKNFLALMALSFRQLPLLRRKKAAGEKDGEDRQDS